MDYLSVAIDATKEPNFDSNTSRILGIDKTKDLEPTSMVEKEIAIIPDKITDMNISGVPDIKDLGKETIKTSEMNSIFDYDKYQTLIKFINKENKVLYGNNWVSTPAEKSILHTNLLGYSYNISSLLVLGRNENAIKWDIIKDEMTNIFKIIVALNIKSSSEISLYSMLTANQGMFLENPNTKIEIFDKSFWDSFLIPLMLKQDQLLGIKFIEFWMYLGMDFGVLIDSILED